MTGTPGTGKSYFAGRLSNFLGRVPVIEINDVVKKRKLFTGKDKDGARIVKMGPLCTALKSEIKKRKGSLIIAGHLAADLDLHYDICVVTRLSLSRLLPILKRRRYGAEKIQENILAEALDYCGVNVTGKASETYEVSTQKGKGELMLYIKRKVEGRKAKRPRTEEVNNMRELLLLIKRRAISF